MSLLSRWFRKAPLPPPASTATPRPASSRNDPAPTKPAAAERAAVAAEERRLQAALEAGDAQAIARLVVEGRSTQVRQSAAQAVDDPELLRQLLRELRGGKDKNVYKILAGKRDAQAGQARQREQLRAEIETAAEAIERHSRRPYDKGYPSMLIQCETRWEALAAQADAEVAGRVQQAFERARAVIADHQRAQAEQAAREQAAAGAERQRQQQAQAAAEAAAEQARAEQEQARLRAAQQAAEQAALREIGELIRKAQGAVSGGGSARAASLRRTIDAKCAALPALPPGLLSQLQRLDQQIAELKDWKNFSVAPKRAELIEEMRLLTEVALDPPALAERIQQLQAEWRGLGPATDADFEADAQRFRDASERAYQPCREYFAAQARLREDNLRRRDALLAELTAFEAEQDWERPDWRRVIDTLRSTRQQWRDCAPVDRAAGKRQQDGFDVLLARLQARVDAEHARNVQQKEALIRQAEALLTSDDSRKAIDAVKGLQAQWRTVGLVPREVDQRLWGRFREHCDAVFQKRQQEFARYSAELDHNKAQAMALCEQLDALAALEGPELLARAGERAGLREAFEALGELPRADTQALRQRFERGLERCEAALRRQKAREAEQSWTDLFDAADRVRAYRLARVQGLDAATLDALKDAAEARLAAVPRWPGNGLEALRQALADAPEGDLAANEAALRLLCIRAEILSDQPTPPEDQPRRRDYQLQRLVQGLGRGDRAEASDLDRLAIEWLAVGPVEESVYQPLLQRFRRCRENGRSRAAPSRA